MLALKGEYNKNVLNLVFCLLYLITSNFKSLIMKVNQVKKTDGKKIEP